MAVDDVVAILESMKLEIPVEAEKAGDGDPRARRGRRRRLRGRRRCSSSASACSTRSSSPTGVRSRCALSVPCASSRSPPSPSTRRPTGTPFTSGSPTRRSRSGRRPLPRATSRRRGPGGVRGERVRGAPSRATASSPRTPRSPRRCADGRSSSSAPRRRRSRRWARRRRARVARRARRPRRAGERRPVETSRRLGSRSEIGYPVAVKASGGGGGIGFRVAPAEDELEAALDAVRADGERFFGNAEVYLERYFEDPRHVEIQVLGDTHGNVIQLGLRDCSVQRRHQKLSRSRPRRRSTTPPRDARATRSSSRARSATPPPARSRASSSARSSTSSR